MSFRLLVPYRTLSTNHIRLYTKAVEQKPDFHIALANLGNAIKDAVRHSCSHGDHELT